MTLYKRSPFFVKKLCRIIIVHVFFVFCIVHNFDVLLYVPGFGWKTKKFVFSLVVDFFLIDKALFKCEVIFLC